MREYYGEPASTAELYFSNEKNEYAAHSEVGSVIALTFCCGCMTGCIRIEKTLVNRIRVVNQDTVLGD